MIPVGIVASLMAGWDDYVAEELGAKSHHYDLDAAVKELGDIATQRLILLSLVVLELVVAMLSWEVSMALLACCASQAPFFRSVAHEFSVCNLICVHVLRHIRILDIGEVSFIGGHIHVPMVS